MDKTFAEIAFTPGVRAAQERYGSRDGYAAVAAGAAPFAGLGGREAAFVEGLDGFYQATVGEGGWPYVQFRGGPRGFLKVLDPRTLGYADFEGNRQYLSVGNLAADDRVALFLIDQANRRRLKIWARARVVDAADDPALAARLVAPGYKARVGRAVVLAVEAFDWNCPQHITPRWSADELAAVLAPLKARLAELEAENARLGARID